ncbi:MAG TPA: hypothetical protein VIH35_07230, partial [Kiritimatiellia bacterium]
MLVSHLVPATVVWSQPLPPGIGGGAPIFPSGTPPGGLTPPPAPGQPPGSGGQPSGQPINPSQPPGGTFGGSTTSGGSEKLILLNFRDSPLDQVLEFVADLMQRTM